MACDTRLKYRNGRQQTISERKDEVRRATERFVSGLKAGRVKALVDKKTGAIAFSGLTEDERDGVTDACAYRRILSSGSQLAIQAILKAEQLAGRSVNRQVVAQGYHSHDGGETWHNH
jgi:hypothetical protein